MADIRTLNMYNPTTQENEIFYPATTTDAVVHPEKRKSITDVVDDDMVEIGSPVVDHTDIRQIKNKGEVFYPLTHVDAIVGDDGDSAIDSYPTAGSGNLVSSGGIHDFVLNNAVYDISLAKATGGVLAEYADLSAALGTNGANVPADIRRGGMSVKFVENYDHKYVQWRLMKDTWSTNTEDWAIAEEGVYVENPEWIYVILDADKHLLAGIKTDGSVEWSIGIPTPVKEYIIERLADIIADVTESLATKVDKEDGKSLVDSEFASGISYIENPEFVKVITDKNKRLLLAIEKNGNVCFGVGVPQQIVEYVEEYLEDIVQFLGNLPDGVETLQQLLNDKVDEVEGKSLIDEDCANSLEYKDCPEYIEVTKDSNNKILSARKGDGTLVEPVGIETPAIKVNSIEIPAAEINRLRNEVKGEFTDVTPVFENGYFKGGGGDTSSNSYIRTKTLHCNDNYLYIVTVPSHIKCLVNFTGLSTSNYTMSSGFSFRDVENIRIAFTRVNQENPLQIENITQDELNDIKIYKCLSVSDYDVTIAAFDSSDYFKNKATIVTTDENAELIIQSLWACLQNCKVLLYPGTYNVYHKHSTIVAGQNACFSTRETTILQSSNLISLHCYNDRAYNNAIFKETEELHALWGSESGVENAMFLCTRAASAKNTADTYRTYVEINDVRITTRYYDKPLTVVDLVQAKNCRIDGLSLWGAGRHNTTSYIPFDTTPNIEYVGIRASHGSNGGAGDYIKHCTVTYYGKGYSICGEHFVIEDCLAHEDYIGFCFGDFVTRGHFEHPNIMIGCSIEGCQRLMYLTKNGITEDCLYADVASSENNIMQSTLVCIGLSTEAGWKVPVDIREYEGQKEETKPIYEVIKCAYRGRIEMDYGRYPVDRTSNVGESCQLFAIKNYVYNNAVSGPTSNRPQYWVCVPGTQYFDTTLNKLLVVYGGRWHDLDGNIVE